jgi:hypothetical protein
MVNVREKRLAANWSIGSKKSTIVKAVPNQDDAIYEMVLITECGNLNIQGVLLRSGNEFINLRCPRNMTLERAFVLWCLLGINISLLNMLKSMVEE